MKYFLNFNLAWIESYYWTSHFVKIWKSQSHCTWWPAIYCAHSLTHQIPISRPTNSSCHPPNEWFRPRDLWRCLLYCFDWLFPELMITLTYCSFDVLWLCAVSEFQLQLGWNFVFKILLLCLPWREDTPPRYPTVLYNLACFLDQDSVPDIRTAIQRLGRDRGLWLTTNLCPSMEKWAE